MNAPEDTPAPATEEAPAIAPAAGGAQRQQGRSLFRFGLIALAVLCGYFSVTAQVEDPVHLYLGLAIAVLAMLPSLMWAKRARYNLPVFEVFMLTGVNTYALPLLSGHDQLES